MFVATVVGEGKLQRCVLSLKISLVCVLLYTFHQLPIMRHTRETTATAGSSVSWFDCLKDFCSFSFIVGYHKILSVVGCVEKQDIAFICSFLSTALLSPYSLFLSPVSLTPPHPPPHPSASCRSVRLPVSVPIRFHLIHVTSINTQSSPDKSRPLSPPLCLSRVALHHSVFPNKLILPLLLVTTYKITQWLHKQVNSANVLGGETFLWRQVILTSNQIRYLSLHLTFQ